MKTFTGEDIDKLFSDAAFALSAYVADLASVSKAHLIRKMLIVVELAGEEEDSMRATAYRRQAEMIEAIGRFRFHDFDEAASKAAE